MADLAEPTASLIDKLTGEVGYDDRLIAYKVLGSSGATRLSLYRFEELVEFLDVPDGEQLLIRGGPRLPAGDRSRRAPALGQRRHR